MFNFIDIIINTFINYAFRNVHLPDNIDIQPDKNQLNIHFTTYQELIDMLLPEYDFKQNIRTEVNTNALWLPRSKYLERITARHTAPMFRHYHIQM